MLVGLLALAGCTSGGSGGAGGPEPPDPTEPLSLSTLPVATTLPPLRRPARATVVDVVDGDTLDVRLADGRVERVRIIGINTPEEGECLADEASAHLADLVEGRRIQLRRDRTDRDDYGRLLRYVLLEGVSVGDAMVDAGLAISNPVPPDTAQQGALDAAQSRARAQGRGRWDPEACGRASSAEVAVGDVRTDPPGDESQALNEEWVEIDNRGDRPVDLTGWGVQDESSSHRFAFPAGFTLPPGASVRIHSGQGRPTATDLYWGEVGSAVWNNGGDTVFLVDPSGNIHDQRAV